MSGQTNRIIINTRTPEFSTAPSLYGLFFEDINHAADGGLYPEMIRNRAFEDSLVPEECTTDPEEKIIINPYGWPGAFNKGEGMDEWAAAVPPTDIPAWYSDRARMTLLTDPAACLNPNRKAALEVCFEEGGSISNIGYCGMAVKPGEAYDFMMFAASGVPAVITAKLMSGGSVLGSAAIALAAGEDYAQYSAVIQVPEGMDTGDSSLSPCLVLTADRACTVTFGFTSLLPERTYKGHGLREDLAEALKNTHSKFIRFPGGCVVEGISERNAWRFSRSIGPVWERPSCWLMWHYRATNGLGFHEYLQLCEDLEMDAMFVCNCGMSCQARRGGGFSEEITDEYLEEALNALSYALDPVCTEYGAKRAAAGHPEPFGLKYVEIGNENHGPEYDARYEKFYHALKERYPQVTYISNGHTEESGLPTEMVDEHYYSSPEFFFEHVNHFEDYDRKGPEIFLGEYAVNGGNTIASMECALAEAAFLTGVERCQDVVKLTAYAPLFQNADYTAWKPNLIVFDSREVYGIPTYHAVSLFGKYRGDEVYGIKVDGEMKPPVYHGVPGILCGKDGLKFKNAKLNGVPVEVTREVYGEVCEAEDGASVMVTGSHRHVFTGKSDAWNSAFGRFIENSPFRGEKNLWAVFGENSAAEDLTEYTFEIDVLREEDNPLTLNIWNFRPDTDAGCNEPKDTEWTSMSVRRQSWRIDGRTSAVRVPGWLDKPLTPDETVQVDIDFSRYNTYKIAANREGFDCYINGEFVQSCRLPLLPEVTASATGNDEEILVKLVHAGEEASTAVIAPDCAVEDDAVREIIAAPLDAVNSFANKTNVSAKEEKLHLLRNAEGEVIVDLPAHSIQVLRLKKA